MINNKKRLTGIDYGKTLIDTADVSKEKHTGYYRCPDGTDIKSFEFFNNGRGFAQFWERISWAMKRYNLENVVIGIESTGPYGEPLLHYLRRKPVRLVQGNPVHTKRLKELHGNSPNKTDKKDPMAIADIISLGHALTVVIPEGSAAELRRLTQARERCVQRRTALYNQLQQLVYLIFPEFLQIMKNVKTKSSHYLLKHLLTPKDIVTYGLEPLTLLLRKKSYGKLGIERATELYTAAKESVGIDHGQEGLAFEIQNILQLIEASNSFVADVEQKMSCHLEQVPYSRFILSIKGISTVTVGGLIGEVGDFNQFGTISEITKLAGLDLFEVSSGKHKGNRRISKRGRPLLRKLLFNAAMNMVSRHGSMRQTYLGYLQRGMKKMKALVAIARKLLRIIFALVRNQCDYIDSYQETEMMLKVA
ncbi:MAG: IS110 family transposase [Nitrospirae bacterium]|nr:IS110 family transposase [Nitrospirota bacterium]